MWAAYSSKAKFEKSGSPAPCQIRQGLSLQLSHLLDLLLCRGLERLLEDYGEDPPGDLGIVTEVHPQRLCMSRSAS